MNVKQELSLWIEAKTKNQKLEPMNQPQKWHTIKAILNNTESIKYFHEREIFYCHLGQNIGHEQDGKGNAFLRPVIVLKKFNKRLFIGIPTTTQPKKGKFYYKFRFSDQITDYAILSQIRLLDAKRLNNKIGKLSKDDFKNMKSKLLQIL